MSYFISHSGDREVPLCVDLDGTLIRSDVLWESMVLLLRRNPLWLFAFPFWLLKGRARLKRQIAIRTRLDPSALPYHVPFLNYLRDERNRDRRIILATASDIRIAESVASHVGLFDDVLASDGTTNLRGENKADALAERYGEKQFDYAGNSSVDLDVWDQCRHAIVVNADDRLVEKARELAQVTRVFNAPKPFFKPWLAALRPQLWLKNLLAFVPLVTSLDFKGENIARAGIAFAALCLCSSAGYVVNDLANLEADRHHPSKKNRPFAAGILPISTGLIVAAILLMAAFASGIPLHARFLAALAGYFAITTAYSLWFRQVKVLDVLFLAGISVARVMAGIVATQTAFSWRLPAFSCFVFLSLALAKKDAELNGPVPFGKREMASGYYGMESAKPLLICGVISGFLAALILGYHVNGLKNESPLLCNHPQRLFLLCPVVFGWLTHISVAAYRGKFQGDPVVFSFRDWLGYLAGALCILVLYLATRP